MARKKINFDTFEQNYLIENFCDTKGKPKHTRFAKQFFYRFANELNAKYAFDIHTCSHCDLTEWRGRAIIMELDHINSVINDSRISNLRPLCPNCHSQTDNFRNRQQSVCDRAAQLKAL
jgi:hypothetical protein